MNSPLIYRFRCSSVISFRFGAASLLVVWLDVAAVATLA